MLEFYPLSQRPAGIASGLLARTFAALRHRNYRLYFIGMVISLTGGWMQIVAAGWLVLRVTGSPLLLGVITAMETACRRSSSRCLQARSPTGSTSGASR